VPNYHQRITLEAVRAGRPIPTERRTIEKLLSKGWIEREPTPGKYRVTQSGIDALKMKIGP
jgi:chromosome segregation and condensation protein ScpB